MRNVKRTVIDMGFRSSRPTRVLLLTVRHEALRLPCTRQYLHFTVNDWKYVAGSDEFRFNYIGRMDVYGYGDNLINPCTLYVNMELFKLVEILVIWGACSWCDIGPLIRLVTTVTHDGYVRILSYQLQPFMSMVHSDGLGQFQDNVTPHTS